MNETPTPQEPSHGETGYASTHQKSCEEREAEIAWREIEEENRRNLPMPGLFEWAKKHGLTTPQA